MDQPDPQTDTVAQAIAYLTAAYESGDTVGDLEMSLIEESFARDDGVALIIGLRTVVTWLLVKLENATGQTASEVLRDIARKNQAR